jgi:hypothetical protein
MRVALVPLFVLLVAGCGHSSTSPGTPDSGTGVGGGGPVTGPTDLAMSTPAGDMAPSGATCLQTFQCAAKAKMQTDIFKCLAMASPDAQQKFGAVIDCFNSQCGNEPVDGGTGPCGTQAQCAACVQTGTSPTGVSIGNQPCVNMQGGAPVTDPKCGQCVDPLSACLAS